MARKVTPTLTEAELRLMDVIWETGGATVNDVLAALPDDAAPAYNTVLTVLRILEKKGYVRHSKEGRAHLYQPLIDRTEARQKATGHMIRNFFNNSAELLVQNIIESDQITPEELARLKKMIEESERR